MFNIYRFCVIYCFCMLGVYSIASVGIYTTGDTFSEENFYVFGIGTIGWLFWGFYLLIKVFETQYTPSVYDIKSVYMRIYPYKKIK